MARLKQHPKPFYLLMTVFLMLFLGAGVLVPQIVMAQNLVLNGDFETGDFSHWTVFQTDDGVTTEDVDTFDTTGTGASYAAKFEVGRSPGLATGFQGGGIYQPFNAPAGQWEVSPIAIAVQTSGSSNAEGGLFELLVDGTVVDSHQFESVSDSTVLRDTLSASGTFASGGSHEIRIRITRPYTVPAAPHQLTQYVDNINIRMLTEVRVAVGGTAEPAGKLLILLPWLGLAAIGAGTLLVLRRRRAQSQ